MKGFSPQEEASRAISIGVVVGGLAGLLTDIIVPAKIAIEGFGHDDYMPMLIMAGTFLATNAASGIYEAIRNTSK